jgi:hypothetical protein
MRTVYSFSIITLVEDGLRWKAAAFEKGLPQALRLRDTPYAPGSLILDSLSPLRL